MSRTYEDEFKRNIERFDEFYLTSEQQIVWDAIKRELTRRGIQKGKTRYTKGKIEFGRKEINNER